MKTVSELLTNDNLDLASLFVRHHCQCRSLQRRGKELVAKLKQVAKMMDVDKYCVEFENIRPFPGYGKTYDAFILVDTATEKKIVKVIPKTEYIPIKGKSVLCTYERNVKFGEHRFEGSWQEAKEYLKQIV